MTPLPADALIPDILAALSRSANLIIEAPPGAGKTTRIPPALLDLVRGRVFVLEPRRIAARLAARRVASEMGERVGETAGYQVRFEDLSSTRTRLLYMTEGVLTRKFVTDPELREVDVVILDEFHERHLETDVALALLLRLQRRRPELKIVVMSATLEPARLAAHLGACPVLRSEGRLFDVSVSYTPHSSAPLEEQVADASARLLAETPGDVLVFLPGAAEIRRCTRTCERLPALVLPLHGDLSPEEQDRAVLPASRRKVILSTNVAESSITIDGVTGVVDSGLARVALWSPWSGLPSLNVQRISRASARQRAGRAGRTAPGKVIRLYTEEDYAHRPFADTPEIQRRELSQTLLELAASGSRDLAWFDLPPESNQQAATDLLQRLHAMDHDGTLTPIGREMVALPLHPRLARMILAAGRSDDAITLAALLSSGQRLPQGDVIALLDAEQDSHTRNIVQKTRSQLRPAHRRHNDESLRKAVLAGFPDRVGRRHQWSLPREFERIDAEYLVGIDVEERREQARPIVRLACAIEPEWLLDLFPERVRERDSVEWNRSAERVEAVSALLYDDLVIDERRSGSPDPEAAAAMLAAKARDAGWERFADVNEARGFLARAQFAAVHAGVPPPVEEDMYAALAALCTGLRSFGDLEGVARKGGLVRAIRERLPAALRQRLDQIAPEKVMLRGGRAVRVHYSPDQPPWIQSRLQDFFGMSETPAVAGGRVRLVVHLLAPNGRPVQTTTDLAGFWERLYPAVRRELSRRYPKHAWPEIP